jgi:hypothetical protein
VKEVTMTQEIINEDREPDAARRTAVLNFIRGRLPGLPLPRPLRISRSNEVKIPSELEGHFAVVATKMDEVDKASIGEQLEPAVDAIINNGVVGDNTVVEIRTLMPEDALSARTTESSSNVMGAFRKKLVERADVSVVYSGSPIMPVEHADSQMDAADMWEEIDDAYGDWNRQIGGGSFSRSPDALLIAMAEPSFAKRLFDGQLVLGGEPLEVSQPVVVTRLGADSSELVLAPSFPGNN